jgi:sugar phosphate permease
MPGPWRIFTLTWISYASLYLCRKNLSVLIPLLTASGGLTKDQLANVVFGYSLMYALGQLTNGALADRFGGTRIVFFGMVVSALATAACGWWYTAIGLLALQMLNGWAQAAGWPGLVKLMSVAFPRSNRGVVMGWWTTNYVVGGFAATLLATWLVTSSSLFPEWSWRRGVWGPALALALIAVVFAVGLRQSSRTKEETNSEESLPSVAAFSRHHVRQVIANPKIQLIAAVYAILKLTRYSFLYWLPLYMTEQLRYSAEEAGYSSAIYELVGFAGVVGAGYLSDRVFQSRRFPVAALMLIVLALACLAHPLLSATSRFGNLFGIALIGAMTFGPDTLLGGAGAQDAAPPEAVATAAGFINGVGSLGQIISPYVVVNAVRLYGWSNLFYFFAALALSGALLLTFSRAERREALAA